MAANKFASMLHRSAHSITVVLVYAVLEWVLILLLLLNSTLSYLIEKFAAYFGLKPPCTWCSRINRVLEPDKNVYFSQDLFCEEHAREISKLGYCSNHQRLAESERLCSDCSSSRPADNAETTAISASIDFFTWVSKSVAENEKKDYRCSCCDESLSKKLDLPCLHFKPSSDIIHHIWKGREVSDDNYGDKKMDMIIWREFEFSAAHKKGNKTEQVVKEENDDNLTFNDEDQLLSDTKSFSFGPVVEEDCSISVSNFPHYANKESGSQKSSSPEDDLQWSCGVNLKYQSANDPVLTLRNGVCSEIDIPKPTNVLDSLTTSKCREEDQVGEYDSISEQLISEAETRADEEENRLLITDDGRDNVQADEDDLKEVVPELDNFAEYKDQQYFSCLNVGAESSDSIISLLEGIDGNFTIEQLKFALKAQQKALNGSYAELEAERSAAAIAATQTMAMISKLQEEKAAMQMEALQYQRMMEEQSEYDQEALQILNDLMIKREKEKQELEKEMEIYRKKVSYYEAREKMMMLRKSASVERKQSSASSSSLENNDELLNDVSCEGKYDNISISNIDSKESETDFLEHLSTLDKSVTEFEEERTSILQELKELEARLLALADDNENLHPIDRFTEDYEQKLYDSYVYSLLEENGNSIGSSGNTQHYPERKALSSTAKRLLPLLDEEAESIEEELEYSPAMMVISLVHPPDLDKSKVAIMEEFGYVYKKLQAFEADKEFLKHSISSLKKGDKGLDLLQEILQHLRDLKSLEYVN